MTIRTILPFRKSSGLTSSGDPISTLQGEVNRLFDDFFGDLPPRGWLSRNGWASPSTFAFNPSIDVKENEKEIKVIVEVPGIDAKEIHLSYADGHMTIKGEKKSEHKEEKEGYYRQECSYGSFQRVIQLPESANFDKAEANVKNGVLMVQIPKKTEPQSKAKVLEVKSST